MLNLKSNQSDLRLPFAASDGKDGKTEEVEARERLEKHLGRWCHGWARLEWVSVLHGLDV
jgi:hypothetical protein